jgi:hypothetical protein
MRVTALLADAATVADGKLYIHGGGWDRLFATAFPTMHPSMAVAVQVEVDFGEALVDHRIDVRLVDVDGAPVGPTASGTFNVGHAPGATPGAPAFVPMALTFATVPFAAPGRFEWVVEIDDVPLARLPLSVLQRDQP